MQYKTNQIAEIAGITVRTLRYYDKIGLLVPSARSEAGYRIYSDDDLERLQQILFFRELDFPLARIEEFINNPLFDKQAALAMQIDWLDKKAERYLKLTQLARNTMNSFKGGTKMPAKDLFDGFDYEQMQQDQKKYEGEVKARWGNSEAYKISQERAAQYSKEDWERINKVQMDNLKVLCELYNAGVAHDDPRAMAIVENALKYINQNFYPCNLEIMSNLGNMYISDERFTAYYEKFAPGLAAYYNNAIQHYCIVNA